MPKVRVLFTDSTAATKEVSAIKSETSTPESEASTPESGPLTPAQPDLGVNHESDKVDGAAKEPIPLFPSSFNPIYSSFKIWLPPDRGENCIESLLIGDLILAHEQEQQKKEKDKGKQVDRSPQSFDEVSEEEDSPEPSWRQIKEDYNITAITSRSFPASPSAPIADTPSAENTPSRSPSPLPPRRRRPITITATAAAEETSTGPTQKKRKTTKATEKASSSTTKPPRKNAAKATANSRPFECPHCDFASKRRYNLTTHIRTHDTNRVKDYECTECDKSFDRRHDRDRHLATVHQGKRSFDCQHCAARFSRRDALRRHLVQQHDYDEDDVLD